LNIPKEKILKFKKVWIWKRFLQNRRFLGLMM
jgi:hypothetical protein